MRLVLQPCRYQLAERGSERGMILREHEHEREHERFTSQGKRELSDTTTNAQSQRRMYACAASRVRRM